VKRPLAEHTRNCGEEDTIKIDVKKLCVKVQTGSNGSIYCPETDVLNMVMECLKEKSSTIELVTS
jgi:hypothetical protein